MPTIRIEMYEGRTAEQKQALVRELTEGCIRALGSSPETVTVMIFDVPKAHWARGGVLASEKPQTPQPPTDPAAATAGGSP